jgi:fatty-acyl-CoA synthase
MGRTITTRATPVAESATKGWLRALKMAAQVDNAPERTLGVLIAQQAGRLGDAPALISDRETFSYRALGDRMSRWARWALAQNLAPGEAVALVMSNRPDYLAAWAGITSVGCVVALINTSLRGPSLAHCVGLAKAARLIVEADFLEIVVEGLGQCAAATEIWVSGAGAGHRSIDDVLATFSGDPLTAAERRGTSLSELALLIYTSGTTGLPKAARVSHHRVMMWAHWFCGIMDARPDDRLYNCLPMHHSVGGVVAPCAILVSGGSVVVSPRFSASRFWSEVVRFDCTIFQYIGELCRYLLTAPPTVAERAHKLRLACGNGLTAEVWRAFEARFGIPRILEFYAATEGNFSLYNLEGEPGALGRVPPFLAHRFPIAIVEFDHERGEPRRDAGGFCLRSARGEAGEAIARMADGRAGGGRFEGYSCRAETQKKVLRDVFEPGDAWVRSGDLMRQDERGFFRFVDRIGDTFRWKGENVSTTEVAEALASAAGVESAVVYGVETPGADGRAGMAAIVRAPGFDLQSLSRHLRTRLPAYARPLFLRLVESLPATETFKRQKHVLACEGFDPAVVADPLFLRDEASDAYVPLDAGLYADLAAGRLRL